MDHPGDAVRRRSRYDHTGKLVRDLALWLFKDGDPPYEAKIAMVCEAFEISPNEAEEQDELLTWKVIQSQLARRVVKKAREQGAKLKDDESKIFNSLLDELDDVEEELGIPEEL